VAYPLATTILHSQEIHMFIVTHWSDFWGSWLYTSQNEITDSFERADRFATQEAASAALKTRYDQYLPWEVFDIESI
jgi:hypothetical protein